MFQHPMLALALVLAPLLYAGGKDVLCLKDGRVIEAPIMVRTSTGVKIHYENGEIEIAQDKILDAVIASDPPPEPANDEEREKLAQGLVRLEGKWLTVKQRDQQIEKRLAAKRKELEAMKARAEWVNRAKQDTKNFHFEYTVPDHIFAEYRDTMEAYFTEFCRAWKIKDVSKSDRLSVCLHANEDAFHQVSGAGGGVLGYFRYVRPWDLNIYFERLDTERSLAVMFHESNHYLQKLIDLGFGMPHFPGESLAEYYGASHWDPVKKKLTVGLVLEDRLVEVMNDIDSGETMPLAKLIETEGMYQHYTWGWTLVHFLMNDSRYAPKFQKFIFTLARGKDVKRYDMGVDGLKSCKGDEVLRVFMNELGIKDADALRKLESEWHEYVRSKLKLVTIGGIEKAAMVAAGNGRILRATRLCKEAIDKGSRNPLVHHVYAFVLFVKGKREDAIAAEKKALEFDPLEGRFWSRLGYLISMKGAQHKAEGERLKALAKELGYDNPWRDIKIEEEDSDDD